MNRPAAQLYSPAVATQVSGGHRFELAILPHISTYEPEPVV